ncbi:MAG: beta-lactamase family protein [Rhodothermales bacterium]|nr:beta-lactamase family protein [Rhodothermales bacterium]MBO6781510.1 beta-lactamase family protein [Rhodothermales bacterium]
MRFLSLMLMAVVSGCPVALAQAPATPPPFAALADSVRAPGIVWAFVAGDSVMLGASGLADRAAGTAMSATGTRIRVASVTKAVTAAAVARLAVEGLLDLDEDLRDRWDWLNADHPVTLRGLLTHTSGLDDPSLGNLVRSQTETLPLERFLRSHAPRQTTRPGAAFRYSNRAFTLAGLVIAEAVDRPFAEAMEDGVFAPLEMRSSSVGRPADVAAATGYTCGECDPVAPFWGQTAPAGDLYTTAEDMGRLLRFLLAEGSWADTLLAPHVSVHPGVHGMALGWAQSSAGSRELLLHAGAGLGTTALLALDPVAREGLFVAVNVQSMALLGSVLEAWAGPDTAPDHVPGASVPEGVGGWYLSGRAPRSGIESLPALFHYGVQVTATTGGLLVGGTPYVVVGNDRYAAADGDGRLAFSRDADLGLLAHRSGRGVGHPETLIRLPRWAEPPVMNEILSFAGGLPLLIALAWPVLAALVWAMRKVGVRARALQLRTWLLCVGTAACALPVLFVFVAGFQRLGATGDVQFALPSAMQWSLAAPWLLLIVVVLGTFAIVKIAGMALLDRLLLGTCLVCGVVLLAVFAAFDLFVLPW